MFIEEPKEWRVFKDFETKQSANDVHLFKINVPERYSSIEECYHKVLTKEELERASRFFHYKDKISYLARTYYLRKILSCFVASAPAKHEFSKRGKNKPVLNGIEFNISHSKDYVLVAVNSSPLGVDLEYVNPDFNFKPMLNSCFDVEEQVFLNATDERFRFYALWTRKEAILKASAEGLTNNLQTVNCLSDDTFRKGNKYNLLTIRFDERYVLSLATKAGSCNVKYWELDC
jgi:4'-phosphopantetheinyl transferase